ncbi:hypothetical protein DHW03_17135 [Pedobacter yonginense]|uniref:Uncharacterized protein n=1 Tax=Pedobacter yonginense TaxID=651869 RepID=A0A317EIN8_9SPHI|nr:hypothetical protein DHW03_17135 [Pedobacter yonginense]
MVSSFKNWIYHNCWDVKRLRDFGRYWLFEKPIIESGKSFLEILSFYSKCPKYYSKSKFSKSYLKYSFIFLFTA